MSATYPSAKQVLKFEPHYAADTLEYRLRQVDVDGSGSTSDPVRIERTVDELELLGTPPNPAQSRATVRFAVPETQAVTLRLYDVVGREVRTLAHGPQEGRTEMQVGLPACRAAPTSCAYERRITFARSGSRWCDENVS